MATRSEAVSTRAGLWVPGSVTDKISTTIFSGTPLWWWIGFLLSGGVFLIFAYTLVSIATLGTGLWGINTPVVWGVAIVNLVFWIGIGHAGTFISAFLLLLRQEWRVAFSRYAEAMTLFALATAGLFPLFHLGRIEFFYYLVPYPNTYALNPQWRSALVWDFFAISTYGLISLVFWFLDLLPDLAAMRDKAKRPAVKFIYGFLALGWRGDARHWEGLHKAAYLLAALATPLVISVHSIVGLDFAIGTLPGWHHTIFPPFFVGGAIFSGLAMMVIFGVILRSGFGMHDLIKDDYMEKAAKLMLLTGLIVTYGYLVEWFGAFYKGDPNEVALTLARAFGTYGLIYWAMIFFNSIVVQLLWFKSVRRNMTYMVLISIGVLIGMWIERFIIVPVSLSYGYTTTSWAPFNAGIWDVLTVVGSFGLFFSAMFVFIRFFPVVPIHETQQSLAEEAANG